jgi:hypothetical protein
MPEPGYDTALASRLDEVVYRCPACHIERKQTVLKDDNVQRGDLN